jgi:hypothetical protein
VGVSHQKSVPIPGDGPCEEFVIGSCRRRHVDGFPGVGNASRVEQKWGAGVSSEGWVGGWVAPVIDRSVIQNSGIFVEGDSEERRGERQKKRVEGIWGGRRIWTAVKSRRIRDGNRFAGIRGIEDQ